MLQLLSSLRTRVLLLLISTFIVLMGAAAYVAYVERQEEMTRALERIQAMAESITSDQHEVIHFAQQFLTQLLEMRGIREFGPTAECQSLLAHLLANNTRFANIAVASPAGNIVCDASPMSHPVNVADRPYFRSALASPDSIVDRPILGRTSGKWGLPVAQALRNAAGHVEGVVVAVIDLQWVNRELEKAKLPDGSRIGLVDATGVVLARHPDPEKTIGKDVSQSKAFKDIVEHGGTGAHPTTGTDGVERIAAFAHFAETTAGPIYLWVAISGRSVTGALDRDFIWTISGALVILGLSFTAIWVFGERWLLHPVSIIVNTARKLGKGDYNARTGLRYTRDELGQLARAFDEMAMALMSKSELLRLNRTLTVLSSCNAALIHAQSETELLNDVCRIIVELGDYRMAWVGFAEQDEDKTVRPMAHYGYEAGYLEAANFTWSDTERGRGPLGAAIRTGKPQVNQDISQNPIPTPWQVETRKRGYQSGAALPLIDRSRVFGVLAIYSSARDGFNGEEVKLIQELASDLAFGIVTLRNRALQEASTERFARSMVATIQAMGAAVEVRDPYTAGHQQRVGQIAAAIARELGLQEEQVRGLQLAGSIHDLGKLSVPAEILTKPSRLTETEMALVKLHAAAGYDIIKNIEFPWPIARMVREHHERLDGSGYPQGLKGGAILLESRILAVADTVEAMASHRPYRPGLGIEKALAEIERGRGTTYDLAVADACLRLFREKGYRLSG